MAYDRVSNGDDITAEEFNRLYDGMEKLEEMTASSVDVGWTESSDAEMQTDINGNKNLLIKVRAGRPGDGGADGKSLSYKGEWVSSTAYVNNTVAADLVKKDGNVYICKANNQGAPPPNTVYWDLFVPKGDSGGGGGGDGNLKGLNVHQLETGKVYAIQATTIPSPGGVLEGNLVETASADDVERKVEKNFDAFYDEKAILHPDDLLALQDSESTATPKESKKAKIAALALYVYPVGSIYQSTNSTSPASLFGGTWESYGNGRVLVGLDTAQTEFDAAGKTGGAKTHTLTEAQMPNHSHENFNMTIGDEAPTSSVVSVTSSPSAGVTTTRTINGITGAAGGNNPHNNLQPYIVVYRWRRVS